jgi:hypothetical protein
MEYKRRIAEVEIDGLGKVYLKSLSAGYWIRISGLSDSSADNIRRTAEMVADSLVDGAGKRIFTDADDVIDNCDINIIAPVSTKIVELNRPKAEGETGKNSESGQA